MKIRKLFSSVIAFLFIVGLTCSSYAAVNWSTTTTGLDVKTDVSSVSAATGRTINMTLLGLDSLGNVDIYGEAGGSTLMASITTLLGTSTDGGGTPGTAAGGSFAATTRYVNLNQGVGLFHLTYPNSASGTDVINVVLYETRTDDGWNTVTREIASKTVSIEVAAATPSAAILNIEKFTKASSDTNGTSDATPANPASENADTGFLQNAAQMTADTAGGIFQVKAYKITGARNYVFDSTATGTVTITLSAKSTLAEPLGANKAPAGTVYTCTGSMVDGVANVSVPTGFTIAGTYAAVATMGDLNSVPARVTNNTPVIDYFDILPLATPASVGLSCNMKVVSKTGAANLAPDANDDGITFDPTFTAKLLDKFGNKIVAAGASGATVKVTDANAKLSDFNIVIAANSNSKSLMQDGSSFSTGLASLTASVPANTLLTASSPVSLKIVAAANQLAMNYTVTDDGDSDLYAISTPVGTSFQFVNTALGVDASGDGTVKGTAGEQNALAATDKIRITNNYTEESLEVAVSNDNPDTIKALFTKPTTAAFLQTNGFLVQHVGESYADCIVYPNTSSALDFTAGSPTQAFLTDQAGNEVSNIVATVKADGSFEVKINVSNFSMKDAYGNTNNVGDVSISTTKGTASPAQTIGTNNVITLSYPAGTTGTDTPTVSFTQPGINSLNNGDGLTITFPDVTVLASFDTLPATSAELSVNSGLPLTIFPRTADGTLMNPADGFFIDYDSAKLEVYWDVDNDGDIDAADIGTGTFVSGANVLPAIAGGTGRLPLLVKAKTTPGEYTITVRSIDNTITKEFKVNVVEYTVPLSLSASAAEIAVGETSDLTITGGSAPYTVATADGSIVTAEVAGSTLTLTGVSIGGPTTVTVSDSATPTNSVDVAVTITAGAAAPIPAPVGQNTAELTGDEIADAPVNMGSVATGTGSQMQLSMNFPAYDGAVDIYVGVQLPDGTFFMLDSDGSLTTDLVPYAIGVTDASTVTVFDAFNVCTPFGTPAVPIGTWSAYSVVAPTNGGDLIAIDWAAGDYDLQYYSFDVSCGE